MLGACEPLNKRRIVVFQPHRYTRTKDLFEKFVSSFRSAEHVILTDIYAASERAIRGVTAKRLSQAMKQNGMRNVEYMKKGRIPNYIRRIAGSDDIVLVLGAGDICNVASELSRGQSEGDVSPPPRPLRHNKL